jgi:hypothetical protein
MPLHILRIQCWGFEPKDYIPTFPFIFPWDVLAQPSISVRSASSTRSEAYGAFLFAAGV